jgi:hypothetical protein
MAPQLDSLPAGLREHLARLFPGKRITAFEELAADQGATHDATTKATGYSRPMRIALRGDDGTPLEVVWRIATANELGHDRRADRAGNLILAFDDFARMPCHVEAIDVGAIGRSGELVSLRDCGEAYLITSYAHGAIYADDLRAIAREGLVRELDIVRCAGLATYLARLHERVDEPVRYRRAIRDLVGHGEGIYGIVDAYPDGVPGAPLERLHALERTCAEWRWRLRGHEGRLTRIHGDFHPFNVVFGDGASFTALDASRGTCGDPADDVTAMSINYLLFALATPNAWRHGLGVLWHRFWTTYARERPDPSLHACAPPFFAWRALVVCNPKFYPDLTPEGRGALLGLAERALDASYFDPAWADELFR